MIFKQNADLITVLHSNRKQYHVVHVRERKDNLFSTHELAHEYDVNS